VVNVWEEDGFPGLASSFRHEFSHPTLQDPALAEWWARAASFRRGGIDRVLEPAPWTLTIEELCREGVRGEVYAHELIRVKPGTAWDLLDRVRHDGVPVLERFGWVLAGAWVTAMAADREALLLWAIPSWDAWGEYEQARRNDDVVRKWDATLLDRAIAWDRFLMVDAPLSPFRTGRQPREEDRDSHRLPAG
jgi:hypothetical protein